MLKIQDLHAYYGPIEALKGISLQVKEGEMVCLIGSNGAGKTTLLNAVSGMIKISGSIHWDEAELSRLSCTKIARLGVMHVPSGRHVFPGLTVRENLEVGTINWRGPFGAAKFKEELETVFALFPRLKERERQPAWSMSGGEQQMLAVGRALMGRPKILLLDEPSMGLAPVVVAELFEKIVEINRQLGLTILLVEQNAKIALKHSHYAYVMEEGVISMEGLSAELRSDPRIRQAYLGKLAGSEEPDQNGKDE